MLPLLALATLTLTPVVTFTSDSVYKNENVLIMEVKENYEEDVLISKDLLIKERNMLGYIIYDNPDTSYIDGLKFDGEYVTDWTIKDFDDTVEHTFLVKTVYTDDIAGMLAAAKNGNWSVALSNPLILIQLFYYILAAISIIAGGFGLLKSRKHKVKTLDEITSAIGVKSTDASKLLEEKALEIVTNIVAPAFKELQGQNQAIIEALILAQAGDTDSRLALINLLKNTANKDINEISDTITKLIKEADVRKAKAKLEADKAVKKIAKGDFDNSDNGAGGISI